MAKKTLPNKVSLEDRIFELELLLLEESLRCDELEEENELLKETPKIIIKEIHHHYPQWNYYPPLFIQQTQPWSPLTGPSCGITGNNIQLC